MATTAPSSTALAVRRAPAYQQINANLGVQMAAMTAEELLGVWVQPQYSGSDNDDPGSGHPVVWSQACPGRFATELDQTPRCVAYATQPFNPAAVVPHNTGELTILLRAVPIELNGMRSRMQKETVNGRNANYATFLNTLGRFASPRSDAAPILRRDVIYWGPKDDFISPNNPHTAVVQGKAITMSRFRSHFVNLVHASTFGLPYSPENETPSYQFPLHSVFRSNEEIQWHTDHVVYGNMAVAYFAGVVTDPDRVQDLMGLPIDVLLHIKSFTKDKNDLRYGQIVIRFMMPVKKGQKASFHSIARELRKFGTFAQLSNLEDVRRAFLAFVPGAQPPHWFKPGHYVQTEDGLTVLPRFLESVTDASRGELFLGTVNDMPYLVNLENRPTLFTTTQGGGKTTIMASLALQRGKPIIYIPFTQKVQVNGTSGDTKPPRWITEFGGKVLKVTVKDVDVIAAESTAHRIEREKEHLEIEVKAHAEKIADGFIAALKAGESVFPLMIIQEELSLAFLQWVNAFLMRLFEQHSATGWQQYVPGKNRVTLIFDDIGEITHIKENTSFGDLNASFAASLQQTLMFLNQNARKHGFVPFFGAHTIEEVRGSNWPVGFYKTFRYHVSLHSDTHSKSRLIIPSTDGENSEVRVQDVDVTLPLPLLEMLWGDGIRATK